jgi:hypothetical protein
MNQIQAFAQANNLDANALESLVSYLRRAIERPAAQKAMEANPSEFLRAGVEAWNRMGQAFYQELLEGTTPRSIEYRKAIAQSVWENARRAPETLTT